MTVVDRAFQHDALPQAARAFARDTMTLGWEERARAHGSRRSDGGVEFGTSLPRGTVLRSGDCLVLEPERLVVTIVERPEPVFVIEPRSVPEWALFAYQIGNRHQPLMVIEGGLVCPEAPGVEQLLEQHQMPYTRATLPFTPASATSGHRH
jgi:urease accessory protein